MKSVKYPFKISQLTKDNGGGYLIEYEDLPGCYSDGETVEEAIKNGNDAVKCWLEMASVSFTCLDKLNSFEAKLSGKLDRLLYAILGGVFLILVAMFSGIVTLALKL